MMQRYRNEAATLQSLGASRLQIGGPGGAVALDDRPENGTALIENMSTLQDGINAIGETLRQRQLLLFPAM